MVTHFQTAKPSDLAAIVQLLADDPLGAHRESPGDPVAQPYRDAFAAMLRQTGSDRPQL